MVKPALPFTAPPTRRGEHTDTYHGTEVADPYRWLEDAGSDETRAWVAAQNEAAEALLSRLPQRAALRERLTALWDFPKQGCVRWRGGRYVQPRNTGLQSQSVLWTADHPDGEWRVLLDPNALSADGTVALSAWQLSPDGRHLAYATSEGGSDWQTWRVREVGGPQQDGQELPGTLAHSKFSGAAWLADGSGFFYKRYPAPAEGEALSGQNGAQAVYLHRLGTPQKADVLALSRPEEPRLMFTPHVSRDGRFLAVTVGQGGPKTQLWAAPLGDDGLPGEWRVLVGEFRASHELAGREGPCMWFVTDDGAPRGKVVRWNLETGEQAEVLPEGPDALETAALVPGGLLALTLHDAHHRLTLYDRDGGNAREVALPPFSSVTELDAHPDRPEVFLSVSGFLSPSAPYRLDLDTLTLTALSSSSLDFGASACEVRQEFAVSPDGTRVPLFIVCRRDLMLDGSHRTLLYGYGGFNISLTPGFSVSRLAWLELGGVLAVANLRGGGEYGEEWHAAGTKARKQNVFDDFIACAEHLIQRGYTRPARLGIQGGSNGGLLVGACMTQRPELFGAALPQVGVMDMLRFQHFTIGWAWTADYGSSDDPELFPELLRYSPLHALRPASYPATLITTGDHDDRVVPAHSYKFAAQLQHDQSGDAPALIRVQTRAGHGAGKPTHLVIEEQADLWAFLHWALDEGAGES